MYCVLQFEAFAKGFMMLCGGPAIHLFSATEIERLVCGNPILDFIALQNNARYDGGFSADHRVSVWACGMASTGFTRQRGTPCPRIALLQLAHQVCCCACSSQQEAGSLC